MILGTNAEQLAKELEPFLKMRGKMWKTYQEKQMEQAGISWIKPIQTEGSLNYNCFRLARTEINNSYREANIISAEKAPWVKGVKWILSGAHVVPDICDTWASQDLYKLGAGCYPPAKTPVDHPNGLCHLNDILVSRNELLDILENRYKKAA